jgi:hypothetical protein
MLECKQRIVYGGLDFNVRTLHQLEGDEGRIVSVVLLEQKVIEQRIECHDGPVGQVVGAELLAAISRQHRQLIADLTAGRLDARIASNTASAELESPPADGTPARGPFEDPLLEPWDPWEGGPDGDPRPLDEIVSEYLASNTTGSIKPLGSSAIPVSEADGGGAAPLEEVRSDADGKQWNAAASEFSGIPETVVGFSSSGPYGPEGGGQPSLRGDLALLALPDLLEFLRVGRRTGSLVLIGQGGMGCVQLRDGQLIGGMSPGCPRLDHSLLRTGAVDATQIAGLGRSSGEGDDEASVVRQLQKAGLISAEQLREAATERMYATLMELLEWRRGKFVFDSCAPEALAGPAVELALNAQAVLLEVLRRIDEQARDGEG